MEQFNFGVSVSTSTNTVSQVNRSMTVKEVADATGVDERTIQREVVKFFPDIVKNGVKTLLTEEQVACISKDLKGHHNLDSTVQVPTTDLEIMANYKAANDAYTGLLERKNSELKNRNIQLESTCQKLADKCVELSNKNMELKNITTSPSYKASEIGTMLGVSGNRIGRIATKNNLKKAPVYGHWVEFTSPIGRHTGNNFLYNDTGVQKIKELLAQEILN